MGKTISEAEGSTPVEAAWDVDVASGLWSSEEMRLPVGSTISDAAGRRPVEAA